jgi:hypothetical protein
MDYQYQLDPFIELKRLAFEEYTELELKLQLEPDSITPKEKKRLESLRKTMARECYDEFGI